MRDAIEKVIQKIADIYEDATDEEALGEPEFRPDYKNFPVTPDSFDAIEPPTHFRRVAAVDGGNLEILGAAKMSVQLNRLSYNIYRDGSREFGRFIPTRIEFLTVTHISASGGKLWYYTHVYPSRPEYAPLLPTDADFVIDANDPTIRIGGFRPQIDRVASQARRFAEWTLVQNVIQHELEAGDIILMDGSLAANGPNEGPVARKALASAESKGVVLASLAKTSRAITTTGFPLVYAVGAIGDSLDLDRWVVQVAESSGVQHFASIFVTRLHPRAITPYRFEVYKKINDTLSPAQRLDIFAQVAHQSKDISFAGYPYGLQVADHEARVRFQEIEPYKTWLTAELALDPTRMAKVSRDLNALHSHETLNDLDHLSGTFNQGA